MRCSTTGLGLGSASNPVRLRFSALTRQIPAEKPMGATESNAPRDSGMKSVFDGGLVV